MQQVWTLFRSQNYRLNFTGQFVSQIGNWMSQTAILWLVYRLTNSVLLIGLVGFAAQAPTLLLAPLGGVWVDRLDRVRLLTFTQLAAAIQALTLAAFVFSDKASFSVLIACAALRGVVNAFDLPARHALNGVLSERREDLASIISLNSTLVNLGRMVGPTLAGFVIAGPGVGFCFVMDAVSFVVALVAIASLELPRKVRPSRVSTVRGELVEGFALALRHPKIRSLLLVTAAVAVFGLSVFTLLPAYAREVFGGGGRTLGLLMSSFSTGAAVSGVVLASRGSAARLGQVIFRGLVLAGGALLVFSFSRALSLSIVCLLLMGAGCVMVVASSNTLVQHLVDENKRGRVMSLYGVSFQGGMPLGALLSGSVAQYVGLAWMSLVNGAACLGLAGLLLSRLEALDGAEIATTGRELDDLEPSSAALNDS